VSTLISSVGNLIGQNFDIFSTVWLAGGGLIPHKKLKMTMFNEFYLPA